MGDLASYPLACPLRVRQDMEPHVKRHIVDTELCGPVSCYLQGDLEKQREGVVFLTVHDIGCTFINWYNFVMEPAMNEIRNR